jgi:hypothetical protein
MEYPYHKQEEEISMSSYFKALKYLGSDVLYPAFHDIIRSSPDSLFMGSSIFALITQSFPLAILVLAMAEFGMIHRLFAGLIGSVQGNNTTTPQICKPGIPSPYQISIIGQLLGEATFPSGTVFFMSAVITYILSSTLNFQEELKELGKNESEWNARIPLSFTFSILLLFFVLFYRIYYNCDSVLSGLGSTILGGIIGFIVYLIHVYLFGRDSINFLGIPLLADRAANGKPLYVCASKD